LFDAEHFEFARGSVSDDRVTKEPATAECAAVLERARELGLLLVRGGLWGQTIRLAPPMCITLADADFILAVLDAAFALSAGK
jgi:alanine-glyoxylate transaminase/(R)-3-amino-2-methylpropionate-pyruvate transaminase